MLNYLVSVVWRTLMAPDTEKPKRKKLWWLMKQVIAIAACLWKLLKLLTGDGEDS